MLGNVLGKTALAILLIGQWALALTLQGTIYDRLGKPLSSGTVRVTVYCGDFHCDDGEFSGFFYNATAPLSANGTYVFNQIPILGMEVSVFSVVIAEGTIAAGERFGLLGGAPTEKSFQLDGFTLRPVSQVPEVTDLNQKFGVAFSSGNLVSNSSFEKEAYRFQGQATHGWVGRWGAAISRVEAAADMPSQFGRHILKVDAGTANFEGQHEGAKYIITEEDPAFPTIEKANAEGRGFNMTAWVRASASAVGRTVVMGNVHTQGDANAFTFPDQNWHKISHTFAGAQVHPTTFAFKYYGFAIHESDNSATPFSFFIDDVQLTPAGDFPALPVTTHEFVDGEARQLQIHTLSVEPGASQVTRSVFRNDYDALGRPWKTWLPFTEACTGATCSSVSPTNPNTLFQGGSNGLPNAGGFAYSQTVYESDPLARSFASGQPGLLYNSGSGHTIKRTPSGTNSLSEASLGSNRSNPVNTENPTFSYEHVKDENGSERMVWKDQLGNAVKNSSKIGNEFVATTAVFDDRSNLIRRLPSISCSDADGNPTPSPNCVYPTEYVYNQRSQVVREKSPDFGEIKYAYNRSGELRAKQTAAQALEGEFTTYKYDALSRQVETGVYKGRFGAYDGSGEFSNAIAGRNEPAQPDLYSYTSLDAAYEDVGQKLGERSGPPVFQIYQVAYDAGEEVTPVPGTEFTAFSDVNGQPVELELIGVSDEDPLYDQLRQERSATSQASELEDRDWPTGTGYTVQTRNIFDDASGLPDDLKVNGLPFIIPPGEGSGHSKGKLVASVNYNPHLSAIWPAKKDRVVSNFYQYDKDGNESRVFRYIGTMDEENLRIQESETVHDKLGEEVSNSSWKNSSGLSCGEMSNFHRFERDGFNRLSKVYVLDEANCAQERQIARYFYLPNGDISAIEIGKPEHKVIIKYGYHIRGWLKSITAKVHTCPPGQPCSEETVYSEDLKRDEGLTADLAEAQFNGNIAQAIYYLGQNSETREFAYIYDGLDRLERAFYTSNLSQTDKLDGAYSYLSDGRFRNSKRGGAAISESQPFQYYPGSNKLMCVNEQIDADSELQSDRSCDEAGGNPRYLYDASGNLVGDRSSSRETHFSHDWRNLPWKVSFLGGEMIMAYDAEGKRVSKIEREQIPGGYRFVQAKHYVGREKVIYESFDGDAPTEINNIMGAGLLGRRLSGNQYEYYVSNHQGSLVTKVADGEDWRAQALYDYFPFGKQVLEKADEAVPVTGTYTGKEFDDRLGLYYFGARYYDADLGLWISPDPARQFASLYATSGNPINFLDPDGMEEFPVDFVGPLEPGDTREGEMDGPWWSYWDQESSAHQMWRHASEFLWHEYTFTENPGTWLLAQIATSLMIWAPETNADEQMSMLIGSANKFRVKPGKLGMFKGTDALRAENKVARDAANAAGLTKDQAKQLHQEISGQGLTYQDIVEIAKRIAEGK